MPKLYFRYGTMNSSKTLNLLAVAHNYSEQKKNVVVIKPVIDTRFGNEVVSRAGLSKPADILLSNTDNVEVMLRELVARRGWDEVDCVLIEETQFLTVPQIDQLRALTCIFPVICYGLRTDYTSHLFPASKRLMEIADALEEIKTECMRCRRKAIINAKFSRERIVKTGDTAIDLGAEDKYMALCWDCWNVL